jgi:hypothetical protein
VELSSEELLTGLLNWCEIQFALQTVPTVPSSISQLFMCFCWQSKWSNFTSLQFRHFDMSAVPTYCSEADGYLAYKVICCLSPNATCLDTNLVPALFQLITCVAEYRHYAFWNGCIYLYLQNINMSPVLRATFPANHGPTPVSVLSVHYCFGVEKYREHLEDQVGDGKIKLT